MFPRRYDPGYTGKLTESNENDILLTYAQQIYIAALWCWGATLARQSSAGIVTASVVAHKPAITTSLGVGVAIFMWFVGTMLFLGLPEYYRQYPGMVPSFVSSVLRRRIVIWFFIMVVRPIMPTTYVKSKLTALQLIQNFFLSAPYGRNWLYLWSSTHLPAWTVGVLVAVFFIAVWGAMLYAASVASKRHSWMLPIFAIGLGAPRWAQMLWGVSGIGLYVPWAVSPTGSAIAGRSLWLWLGVLDSIQNVGYGQILLHTLTRFHIAFTLIVAQVLGSVATIGARAFSPNRLGPGPIFPNLDVDTASGLQNGWFWSALFAQLAINLVALRYFRKEQLSKP